MAQCNVCRLAGNLEIYRDGILLSGIVSAALTAGTDIIVTPDTEELLKGPTTGSLNIVAYPYLAVNGEPIGDRLLNSRCRGRASVNIDWVRRYDCDTNTLHFIPRKGGRSYLEGEFDQNVLRLERELVSYTTFQADAAGGPHTPYMLTTHTDGWNLQYFGLPIAFSSAGPLDLGTILLVEREGGSYVLPLGTELYLTAFELTIDPPFTSRVTYSFLFYLKPEGPC